LAGAAEQLQMLCKRQKQGSLPPVVDCGIEASGQAPISVWPSGQDASGVEPPRRLATTRSPSPEAMLLPPSGDGVPFLLSAGSLEWVGPERAWLPTLRQAPLPGSRAQSPSMTSRQTQQPCFNSDGENGYCQLPGSPLIPRSRGASPDCQGLPRAVRPSSSLTSMPRVGLRSAEREAGASPCRGLSMSLPLANASPPVGNASPPFSRRNTAPSLRLPGGLERSSFSGTSGTTPCGPYAPAVHNSGEVAAAPCRSPPSARQGGFSASVSGPTQVPFGQDPKRPCQRDPLPPKSVPTRLYSQ